MGTRVEKRIDKGWRDEIVKRLARVGIVPVFPEPATRPYIASSSSSSSSSGNPG